jgi:glycosyltransferase involved in cell wall biosynthesis
MRILFFASYPTLAIGYSRTANILSNYLAKQGHEVYYLGISNFGNNYIERFVHPQIILLDALKLEKLNNSDELYGVNVICDLLQSIKPDILFLYNDIIVISRIFNNFITRKISKNFKICVYLDLVYEYQKYELIKHVNNFADILLVFSDCWKENLINMGVNENKIKIQPFGFDNEKFYPIDKLICRKIFGFDDYDFIIFNTNRNNYRKSIDKTVDAFVGFLKLKKCNPNIKLFLNMNHEQDNGEGYDIKNLIQIACIRNKLDYDIVVNKHVFVYKQLNISDSLLNSMYNACDVGINTCVGEGFGLCNLEHGGIGKPQIISGVGAFNDLFTNDYSSIIKPVAELYISNQSDFHGGYIKICSTDDFVSAINKYYEHPELIKTHGELCRNIFLHKYNWNNILNDLNNVINCL